MAPEVQGADPALIFNFDETMLFAKSRTKVIASGDKKMFRRKAQTGPHFTLGLCFSPLGAHPPPLVILPVVNIAKEFAYFEGTRLVQIANSSSGWMTTEVFNKWAEAFCNWLNLYRLSLPPELQEKKAILFMDNCRTHCSIDALQSFAGANVEVITFPPHVTHVLQPIDVGCVRALKTGLSRELKSFEKHIDKFVTTNNAAQRQRAQLVLSAISALGNCNFRVCSNAFRKSGIFPFASTEPLASQYVRESEIDPEEVQRRKRPGILHLGSSVLTSDDFMNRLRQTLAEKTT
jgi:hypothetical protein